MAFSYRFLFSTCVLSAVAVAVVVEVVVGLVRLGVVLREEVLDLLPMEKSLLLLGVGLLLCIQGEELRFSRLSSMLLVLLLCSRLFDLSPPPLNKVNFLLKLSSVNLSALYRGRVYM